MIDRSRRRHARGSSAVLGLLMALCVTAAGAQPPAEKLVGDWFLTLEERNAVHTGILTIERDGGTLVAFVDGGPSELELADGQIELTFDTRDGGGQLLSYALSGRLEGDSLRGELTPPLDAPKGSWHAERHAVPHAAPPQPVDFTGIWSRTSSGLARVTLDYTPLGGSAPTHLWIPKWLPGQRLLDPYRMVIPDDLPPGTYYIEVGLYEMVSKRRLHLADETGNLIGDRLILGPIEVMTVDR